MNVIFLDIDGVMNSNESIVHYHEMFLRQNTPRPWNTDAIFPISYMKRLKSLVDMFNAKIVISSTWRIFYPDGWKWYRLIENLREFGLEVEGTTIRNWTRYKQRGDEIRHWLSEHLDVTNFVILDDDSDMCEFTETNLAKCDFRYGFTKDVLNKAIKILNIKEKL